MALFSTSMHSDSMDWRHSWRFHRFGLTHSAHMPLKLVLLSQYFVKVRLNLNTAFRQLIFSASILQFYVFNFSPWRIWFETISQYFTMVNHWRESSIVLIDLKPAQNSLWAHRREKLPHPICDVDTLSLEKKESKLETISTEFNEIKSLTRKRCS